MNRLILIGNGFDLAHGMKTSYNHFIEYLWEDIRKELNELQQGELTNFKCKDDLISLKSNASSIKVRKISETTLQFVVISNNGEYTLSLDNAIGEFIGEFINIVRQEKRLYNFNFFMTISEGYTNKTWSDIEADYYSNLLEIIKSTSEEEAKKEMVKNLNMEFKSIKNLLKKYLGTLKTCQKNKKTRDLIYSHISPKDISLSSWDVYVDDILNKLKKYFVDYEQRTPCGIAKTDQKVLNKLRSSFTRVEVIDNKRLREEIESGLKEIQNAPLKANLWTRCLLNPEEIMFLNFNYTKTEKIYIEHNSNSLFCQNAKPQINHIHGTLDDINNHVIFGYGDEEADEYKELENSNILGLLDNVKSINYLEAPHYRDMERFIESGSYQIFLMGMSCGLADRTLLRKLFQHRNCISVKPFYYEWKENENKGKNNYTEISQNISRCFSNKDLLRSIVVNKHDCEALPQIKKSEGKKGKSH